MPEAQQKILAICGSTRRQSVNLALLQLLAEMVPKNWIFEIDVSIGGLPHFNQDEVGNPPAVVQSFHQRLQWADGVIFCTPEYVFSLPGVVKNAIEWTVATTLFSEKPVGLITASSLGQKAHESLCLVMKTIYAKVHDDTSLLISGANAKVKASIEETDPETAKAIIDFVASFDAVLQNR
ncbi:MAG: azr 2 [Flaviaesturariibacter sp.]|nr:azr 2 [Flaviaesturariibacter sp.]